MNGQRSLARPRTQDGRCPGSRNAGSIKRGLQQTLQNRSVVWAMSTQPSVPFAETAVRAKHLPCTSVRFDDHTAAVNTDQTHKRLIDQGADHPLKLARWEPGLTAGRPFSTNRHCPPPAARGIALTGMKIPGSRRQLRLLGVY